jgi:hypothetical protein
MRGPLIGLLALAGCSARPAIGGSEGGGTDEGTSATSSASGSGSASTSATSGDPDTGETDSDSGPPPDCEDGPGGAIWTRELESEGEAWADAIAVGFDREVSVAGNDGERPTLWRLDANGEPRWKGQTASSGRSFGVAVDELGEPFLGWNQKDAVGYMHFGLDGETLLESISLQPGRYAADLAVVPLFVNQ